MLDKLAAVKRANKVNFANYLEKTTGQVIDPDSIFDCQVNAHARVQAPAPERHEHCR